jgi:CrcB protein
MMKNILFVGLGGGAGSIARYAFQRWLYQIYPGHFPWGTFGVNILGCFLIGIFWGISFRSFEENESWKLFLMTGLCGGFTTFSAFTLEGIGLLKEQRLLLFSGYLLASVALGLLATWLGTLLTK